MVVDIWKESLQKQLLVLVLFEESNAALALYTQTKPTYNEFIKNYDKFIRHTCHVY